MKQSSKIIVTVIIVIVWIVLSAAVTGIRSDAGNATPGILGLALFAALIGSLRAVWKKEKDDNDNTLQK